jgi:6-phosphogluconolactonase (cycloisomerase 2 family)
VAVDPTGQFAYEANLSGNTVSAYSIGSDGALTPVPGSPFRTNGIAVSVAVDPTGQFAYVANAGGNTVSGYSIDRNTGALTPVPASPFAAGSVPNSVAVTAQFAYVTNRDQSTVSDESTVSGYSIDRKTGALTPVPGSPFGMNGIAVSVAVDPTGQFAYVANQTRNTVSAYSIDRTTGALTAVPGSPFATGSFPTSIAITPLVPFATSFAKLEIEARHRPGFELKEFFTLGTNSNGIDPVTENMTLQIGSFSVTIPAGSFEQDPNGRFEFEGVINDLRLEVQIVPLGNNIFTFKAKGTDADLTGLTNPVTMVLTIGVDSGSTAVRAEYGNQKEHHGHEHARFTRDFPGDND